MPDGTENENLPSVSVRCAIAQPRSGPSRCSPVRILPLGANSTNGVSASGVPSSNVMLPCTCTSPGSAGTRENRCPSGLLHDSFGCGIFTKQVCVLTLPGLRHQPGETAPGAGRLNV